MFKALKRKFLKWFKKHQRVNPIIIKIVQPFEKKAEKTQNSGSAQFSKTKSDKGSISSGIVFPEEKLELSDLINVVPVFEELQSSSSNQSFETKSSEDSINSDVEFSEEKLEPIELKEITKLKKLLTEYNNIFYSSINDEVILAELKEEMLVTIDKAKKSLKKYTGQLDQLHRFLATEPFLQKALATNLIKFYTKILSEKQNFQAKDLKKTVIRMEEILRANPDDREIQKFYKAVRGAGITKESLENPQKFSDAQIFYKKQIGPIPEIIISRPPRSQPDLSF